MGEACGTYVEGAKYICGFGGENLDTDHLKHLSIDG
jgi:hypothetical protein